MAPDAVPPLSAPSLGELVAFAWEAYHAADWLESVSRWDRIRVLHPDYEPPYIHAGVSLREAGCLEEAEARFRDGLAIFPDSAQLVSALGWCLAQMGRAQETDAWFGGQVARFPDNPEIAIDHLRILERRHDPAGLLRAAAVMEQLHPERMLTDAGVRHIVSEARLQIELARMDRIVASPGHSREAAATTTGVLDDTALMLRFQGLGENCAFGLMQRFYGAEPLGLLRWGSITIENLILALDEGFAGVGEREQTLFITGDDEYATAHTRYGMGAHSFVKIDAANEAAIQDKLLVRLGYLRREMLAELEEGSAVFVFTSERGVDAAQIASLHRALSTHGSRFLLVVRKADADNPPGVVRDAGGGLMLGYLDRLGPDRRDGGAVWGDPSPDWPAVLREALRLRREAEHAG